MDSHFNIFVYYPLSILSNFDNFVYSRWVRHHLWTNFENYFRVQKILFFSKFHFFEATAGARDEKKSFVGRHSRATSNTCSHSAKPIERTSRPDLFISRNGQFAGKVRFFSAKYAQHSTHCGMIGYWKWGKSKIKFPPVFGQFVGKVRFFRPNMPSIQPIAVW